MKRLLYVVIGVAFFVQCFAQTGVCDDALEEGKELYNKGQFQRAKELFLFVQNKSACGSSYGNVSWWITQCNEAMKSKPQPQLPPPSQPRSTSNRTTSSKLGGSASYSPSQTQKSQSHSTYVAPTLSVSETVLYFDASGGSSNIEVKCNKDWGFTYLYKDGSHQSRSFDFQVERWGDRLKISCSENYSSSTRSAQFDVLVKENGFIKIRQTIYLNQHSCIFKASTDGTQFASVGGTHKISVSSNTSWYVDSKSEWLGYRNKTNTGVEIYCYENYDSSERSGYVKLRTMNGAKSNTFYFKQNGAIVKSSRPTNIRKSPSEEYFWCSGHYSVKWANASMSIGYPYNLDFSVLDFRIFWFDLSLVNFGLQTDYRSHNWYWQPNFGVTFPIDGYDAIRVSAGPKYNFRKTTLKEYYNYDYEYYSLTELGYYRTNKLKLNSDWWFNVQVGYVLEWEDYFSTEFFIRYNGGVAIGATINVHTNF